MLVRFTDDNQCAAGLNFVFKNALPVELASRRRFIFNFDRKSIAKFKLIKKKLSQERFTTLCSIEKE